MFYLIYFIYFYFKLIFLQPSNPEEKNSFCPRKNYVPSLLEEALNYCAINPGLVHNLIVEHSTVIDDLFFILSMSKVADIDFESFSLSRFTVFWFFRKVFFSVFSLKYYFFNRFKDINS